MTILLIYMCGVNVKLIISFVCLKYMFTIMYMLMLTIRKKITFKPCNV